MTAICYMEFVLLKRAGAASRIVRPNPCLPCCGWFSLLHVEVKMSYGASVNGVKGKHNRLEGTTRALYRSHNATDQRSHDSTTHSTRGTRPPDCILIRHGEHARPAAAATETAMHRAKSNSSPHSAEGEAKLHRPHGVSSMSLLATSITRTSGSHPRFTSLFSPVLSVHVSAMRAAASLRVFEQRNVHADVASLRLRRRARRKRVCCATCGGRENAGKKAALC
jgi:hypothetical protein